MFKKNPLAVILGVSALFFVIFMVVALMTVMNLSGGAQKPKLFGAGQSIGVLEVNGVIMESKDLLKQIDKFAENDSIKGVLVRINSPGGAVAPSQEVYEALRNLSKKKPVYSSMATLAASGGYYVACGTKRIFANPGTITGSIGVIMQFADLSKLYEWAKINPYSIKTGKFKDIGSPNKEMGPEEKALLQEMVNNVLGQFRRAVVAARNLPMEKVVELSDGRIYSGEQAKAVKLVDDLGTFDDAVTALAQEVGIKGKPHLIYPSKKRDRIFDLIFQDMEEGSSRSSVWNGSLSTRVGQLVLGLLGLGGSEMTAVHSGAFGGPMFLMPQVMGR